MQRAKSPLVILGVDDGNVRCVIPLQKSEFSSKIPHVKCLEHIAKSFTDYHEFLFDEQEDLEKLADQFGRFLESYFKDYVLKIEFPPPKSRTEHFLSLQNENFERLSYGTNYVFQNLGNEQHIDPRLASDIERRMRKAQASHKISYDLNAQITEDLLEKILNLHESHHGITSFNAASSRADIIELLMSLKSQLICSVLYLDNHFAACVLSFKTGEQLQYYAPAFDDNYRNLGLGMILFRYLQLNLNEIGVNSICLLRGEEPYKVRVSNTSTSVESVLWISRNTFGATKFVIRMLCGRRNKEIQQRRAFVNRQLRRSCAGRYAVVLANGLNGLGVVRALNEAEIQVVVICPNTRDLAALSNASFRLIIEELDSSWEQRILGHLQTLASEIDDNIPLYSCSDRAANFVESYNEQFPDKIKVIFPSGELIHILNDKQRELAFADKHNIPIPSSVWDTTSERPFDDLDLPIIIKPKDFKGYAVIKAKNIIVEKQQQLESFYELFGNQLELFVAQELIDGPDENLWVCNATFDTNNKLVCAFTFRRLGTTPSHFGVTSMAYSEHNPHIKAIVAEMGAAIGYQGPGMWEFKFCSKKNQYLYIETNPRLGMCNWFDSQCNVSNVLVTYYLSHGIAVNPRAWEQSTGIYFVNGLGDTISRLEDKEPIRSITHRLIYVLTGPVVWATWWNKDKIPTIVTSYNQLRSIFRRAIRRVSTRQR